MVAGKVKVAMGLQKSPARTKQETPPPKPPLPAPSSTAKNSNQKAVFSRSFGVYFPRSSAQVQPRPPDVTELLRLVEDLRERESLLKTELLEHKLLKESVAILPLLENEIATKDAEIDKASKKTLELEAENERLRIELEAFKANMEVERRESEKKIKELEAEMAKTASDRKLIETGESEELSYSQRFQGLIDLSVKSNLIRSLKKGVPRSSMEASSNQENQKLETEIERPRHSRCNSEEIAETSDSALPSLRSRVPRVPKPPPRPSFSSSTSSSSPTSSSSDDKALEIPIPPPPPSLKSVPPPPPPPPKKSTPAPPPAPPLPAKGLRQVPAKVRRVPEVVEFYHSLMRRDSRRDSGASASDLPATANARDMIGEIENRSAYLLAVSSGFWSGIFVDIFTKLPFALCQ